MSAPKLSESTLRLDRVTPGRPVALGDTRKLGVTTGHIQYNRQFPDMNSLVEVLWASGATEWVQVGWLADFDTYIGLMEAEANKLNLRRTRLAARLAGTSLTPR